MNILAVGCHPDDLEIGCGGTLSTYVGQGHAVFMCHVANGDKGHTVIMPEELKKIRENEAVQAGRIIGAKEVINLDIPDLGVNSYNETTVNKLIDVIRETKPDVRGMQWQGMSLWTTLRYGPDMWIPSTFMPTLAGKLLYLKELAGPLVAECN